MDYYNLKLVSHEFTTGAFQSYRSRQLQAPKALLMDHLTTPTATPTNNNYKWIDLVIILCISLSLSKLYTVYIPLSL